MHRVTQNAKVWEIMVLPNIRKLKQDFEHHLLDQLYPVQTFQPHYIIYLWSKKLGCYVNHIAQILVVKLSNLEKVKAFFQDI